MLETFKPIFQVLLLWIQNASGLEILIATGIFMFLAFLYTKLIWTHHSDLKTKELKKLSPQVQQMHNWYKLDYMEKPLYCNICEVVIVMDEGFGCAYCQYAAHTACLTKKSNKTSSSCKKISMPRKNPNSLEIPHQWMKGNLPLASRCIVCSDPCGDEPRLADFRCVWCQTCIHESCLVEKNWSPPPPCSLGTFHELILPPTAVIPVIEKSGWRPTMNTLRNPNNNGIENYGGKKYTLQIPNELRVKFSPLLIFINPKSGGTEGGYLLRKFREILNPIQLVDLSLEKPNSKLELFYELHSSFKILVCGGDGSIGWILTTIEEIQKSKKDMNFKPPVGVLPLGTGNDLARVLGWGKKFNGKHVEVLLEKIQRAQPTLLDRWKIDIQTTVLKFKQQHKIFTMNNYLGVGVDAHVAFEFHQKRQASPELFRSRILNKLWYGVYGGKDMLEQRCKDLPKFLEVELDGKKLNLPDDLQGVVCLNIPSFGGGADAWDESIISQHTDDKKFEVMGIFSSFHVATMVMGVRKAQVLGQGSKLIIKLKTPFPIQVDGEPWIQSPCTISIVHSNQAVMLKKIKKKND